MTRIWSSEAASIITALGAIVVLGLLSGDWTFASLFVLVFYILWLYRRLARLEKWIRRGTKVSQVYDDPGFISIIIRHLYQQKKQHNQRKKRTKAILGSLNRNISALPDATVLLNSNKEIVWCNEPARYLLNIRSPQDLGFRISNLIRDPEFRAYLDGNSTRESIEIDSPVDPEITVQVRIAAIGDNQTLLIAHNVSDQKLLQESLTNFVANASHELKSPLTVISGHLELLEAEDGLSEAGKQSLRTAQYQTERMRELIESLLLLSQVESYQLRPDEGNRVSVRDIMLTTQTAIEKYPDRERVRCDYPDDWFLLGVKPELEGICINLVENALKYSTPATPIHAFWESNTLGEYVFSVVNQGPGIDPQDLPRVTERYFRGARNGADIAGTGLGLAIVQQAANKHGAMLEFDSEPGGETRFDITFPSFRCSREQHQSARVYRLSEY
jgi:two-component system phosphate regulon sensor histidine kinase PhoR